MSHYKGFHDCDTIKRFAFECREDCYINSGEGGCFMLLNKRYWDILWEIYECTDVYDAQQPGNR